jgi:hypothetical protein
VERLWATDIELDDVVGAERDGARVAADRVIVDQHVDGARGGADLGPAHPRRHRRSEGLVPKGTELVRLCLGPRDRERPVHTGSGRSTSNWRWLSGVSRATAVFDHWQGDPAGTSGSCSLRR